MRRHRPPGTLVPAQALSGAQTTSRRFAAGRIFSVSNRTLALSGNLGGGRKGWTINEGESHVKKILLAAFGLAVTSSAALAADLGGGPVRRGGPPPPPPPVVYQNGFSWSGFYVGVQGGYAWGDTEAFSSPPDQSYDYSTDGFLGGAHAGFNWQANRFVIGIETDIELADISGSGAGTLGSDHSTEIEWLGSLRARLGLAADRTLFYVTGGLAYGDVAIAGPGYDFTETRTGWTAGAGIEHAFAFMPNTTARIEYRYTDLGSSDFSEGGVTDDSDVTFSAVRAGLSWKF